MSERGIEAGSRWVKKLDEEMESTEFGILFLTPENQGSPWLVHEAGALGKSVEESRVVPVAIDMDVSDIDWPLARFQGVQLCRDGVLDLLQSINNALEEDQLEVGELEKAFDGLWEELDIASSDIPDLQDNADSEQSAEGSSELALEEGNVDSDKIDEILELTRSMSRNVINKNNDVLENITRALRGISNQLTQIEKRLDQNSESFQSSGAHRNSARTNSLHFDLTDYPEVITKVIEKSKEITKSNPGIVKDMSFERTDLGSGARRDELDLYFEVLTSGTGLVRKIMKNFIDEVKSS
jgi:hypothetical protein